MWRFTCDDVGDFVSRAHEVLLVLRSMTGFVSGVVARNLDANNECFVSTTWIDVGSMRRALSSTQSKMEVWPFLSQMRDEPSAYEVLGSITASSDETFESGLTSGL